MLKFKDFINEKQTDKKYELVRDNAKITGNSNLFGRYNVDWDIDSEDIDQGDWQRHDPKLINK